MAEDRMTACVLRGVGADGGSVRFVLSGDRALVGRQGEINLRHESVSRRHALLERRGGDWILTDLGSRNGTFVNRASVQRHRLANGDVVRFGGVTLRFETGEEGVSPDASTGAMTMEEMTAIRDSFRFSSLVGRSEALRQAMQMASRAAKSRATVLVLGETGTGKELFARFICSESDRKGGRFLAVNCGALAPTLQDSTLFGHERGAFTGADRRRPGVFEEASGGTLFLDEIGELTLDTQAKLLRVLQEGEIMRLGSVIPIRVDVRLICATNRDLAKMVEMGEFRQDLYYRLNVIRIRLPPLRDRREDIPDLVNHFASQFGGQAAKTVSAEAMTALTAYGWPGNVRELRNVVENVTIMGVGHEITVEDLPPEIKPAAHESEPMSERAENLEEMELRHVLAVLDAVGGNKKLAAERLSISRSTLYGKLARAERLGLGKTMNEKRQEVRNETL